MITPADRAANGATGGRVVVGAGAVDIDGASVVVSPGREVVVDPGTVVVSNVAVVVVMTGPEASHPVETSVDEVGVTLEEPGIEGAPGIVVDWATGTVLVVVDVSSTSTVVDVQSTAWAGWWLSGGLR